MTDEERQHIENTRFWIERANERSPEALRVDFNEDTYRIASACSDVRRKFGWKDWFRRVNVVREPSGEIVVVLHASLAPEDHGVPEKLWGVRIVVQNSIRLLALDWLHRNGRGTASAIAKAVGRPLENVSSALTSLYRKRVIVRHRGHPGGGYVYHFGDGPASHAFEVLMDEGLL